MPWNKDDKLVPGPVVDLASGAFANLAALYKTSVDNTPATGGQCTVATATCGTAQTYDMSALSATTLTVYYTEDGGTTWLPFAVDISVTATANDREDAATAADVVADLNGNELFSTYLLAEVSTSKVKISSLALGSNVKFYVLDSDVEDLLVFTQASVATAAAGTGTPVDVQMATVDAANQALAYRQVGARLYDASTDGSLSTTAQIQKVTKGSVVSGLHSANAVLRGDENGELDVQVASTAADETAYLELGGPSGYWLVELAMPSRESLTLYGA